MKVISLKHYWRLLAWLALSPCFRVKAVEELIWNTTGRLLVVGQTIEAQNGNCRLAVQGDGNLVMRRRIPGLDNKPDVWRASWSTDCVHQHAPYALELRADGNLEVTPEGNRKLRRNPPLVHLLDRRQCSLAFSPLFKNSMIFRFQIERN